MLQVISSYSTLGEQESGVTYGVGNEGVVRQALFVCVAADAPAVLSNSFTVTCRCWPIRPAHCSSLAPEPNCTAGTSNRVGEKKQLTFHLLQCAGRNTAYPIKSRELIKHLSTSSLYHTACQQMYMATVYYMMTSSLVESITSPPLITPPPPNTHQVHLFKPRPTSMSHSSPTIAHPTLQTHTRPSTPSNTLQHLLFCSADGFCFCRQCGLGLCCPLFYCKLKKKEKKQGHSLQDGAGDWLLAPCQDDGSQ